jgi:small subunit ribosomal protein S20
MPIKKSAKKALRQSLRRRKINLFHKNRMKKIIKEIKGLVLEKKKEEAKKLLPLAYKYIDKAAKRGVIKENTAARKKSKITKLVQA